MMEHTEALRAGNALNESSVATIVNRQDELDRAVQELRRAQPERPKSHRERGGDGPSDPDDDPYSDGDSSGSITKRKKNKSRKKKAKKSNKKKTNRTIDSDSNSSDSGSPSPLNPSSSDSSEDDSHRFSKRKDKTGRKLRSIQRRDERTLISHVQMQPRYLKACDWRTYRLQNKSPVPTAAGARAARKRKHEFTRFVDHHFNGSDPASILWFLQRFVTGANYIGLCEGDAVWVFADYLDSTPKEMVLNMLRTTTMADVGNTDVTYVRIVSELLQRYATDDVLHNATEDVSNMRQNPNQKALRYHDRLIAKANRLGNVFGPRDLLNIFMRGIDDMIRPAVQQRYDDQAAQFRKDGVTPSEHQLTAVIRNLAIYADTLRRDANSVPPPNDRKGRRNDNRQHVSTVTTPAESPSMRNPDATTTTHNSQLTPFSSPPVPRLEAPPSALAIAAPPSSSSYAPPQRYGPPPSNSSQASDYSTRSSPSRYGQRNDRRPPPTLPMDQRFVIPQGCTDIRHAVHDMIENSHICRICLLSKDAAPTKRPHNTSECPMIPEDPEQRYVVLATRLANLHRFEQLVKEGKHPPIHGRHGSIGPVPEGLRGPVQPRQGAPPPILRAPSHGSHSKN